MNRRDKELLKISSDRNLITSLIRIAPRFYTILLPELHTKRDFTNEYNRVT